MMLNWISDKYCDFLIKRGKLNVRNSKEWSDFDYRFRYKIFNRSVFLTMLFLNIITHSWLQMIVVCGIFYFLRTFTGGIHAKRLSFCFLFSSCYFTILSVISHRIIYSNNIVLYYTLPFLIIIWSIYNYRYIPKANINAETLDIENDEEILTIDEKKQAYRWIIGILSIIIIGGIFLFKLKFIPIGISMGLISLQGILSNTGERIFNFIQDKYLKLIDDKINQILHKENNSIKTAIRN